MDVKKMSKENLTTLEKQIIEVMNNAVSDHDMHLVDNESNKWHSFTSINGNLLITTIHKNGEIFSQLVVDIDTGIEANF